MLKVLGGRMAGDMTLMLRISRGGGAEAGDLKTEDERGEVKCRLGIVDFDAKYLY